MSQINVIIYIRFIRRFYSLLFFFFCNRANFFCSILLFIIPLFWILIAIKIILSYTNKKKIAFAILYLYEHQQYHRTEIKCHMSCYSCEISSFLVHISAKQSKSEKRRYAAQIIMGNGKYYC